METAIGPLQVGSHVEVKWVEGEAADQQFYDAVVTAVRSYAGASARLDVDICHLPVEFGWTETLRVSGFEQGRVRLPRQG